MAPSSLIGEMADVTVTDLGTNSLFGTLARPAMPHAGRAQARAGSPAAMPGRPAAMPGRRAAVLGT
jgi:hypothetical protein